jgi:hypothetical protein
VLAHPTVRRVKTDLQDLCIHSILAKHSQQRVPSNDVRFTPTFLQKEKSGYQIRTAYSNIMLQKNMMDSDTIFSALQNVQSVTFGETRANLEYTLTTRKKKPMVKPTNP